MRDLTEISAQQSNSQADNAKLLKNLWEVSRKIAVDALAEFGLTLGSPNEEILEKFGKIQSTCLELVQKQTSSIYQQDKLKIEKQQRENVSFICTRIWIFH